MKRRKHTPDQVVRKLREADRLLADSRGRQAPRDLQADLSSVAQAVRRLEGRRCQTPQGADEGEHAAQAHRRRQGAQDRRPEGGRQGKLLSPSRRRSAVTMLQDRFRISERCVRSSATIVAPSVVRSCTEDDDALRRRLHAFSAKHKRWGYRKASAPRGRVR